MRFVSIATVAGLVFACSHGSASSSASAQRDAPANTANQPASTAAGQDMSGSAQ